MWHEISCKISLMLPHVWDFSLSRYTFWKNLIPNVYKVELQANCYYSTVNGHFFHFSTYISCVIQTRSQKKDSLLQPTLKVFSTDFQILQDPSISCTPPIFFGSILQLSDILWIKRTLAWFWKPLTSYESLCRLFMEG